MYKFNILFIVYSGLQLSNKLLHNYKYSSKLPIIIRYTPHDCYVIKFNDEDNTLSIIVKS